MESVNGAGRRLLTDMVMCCCETMRKDSAVEARGMIAPQCKYTNSNGGRPLDAGRRYLLVLLRSIEPYRCVCVGGDEGLEEGALP